MDIREHFRTFPKRALVLSALITLTGIIPVESIAQSVSTDGPARPKLVYDGHFEGKDNDGSYLYSLYYYFEESRGGFKNQDSHVFYPPPYHLVTEKDGKVKYLFDHEDRSLTLWVRKPTTNENIERTLREHLITQAVENYAAKIIDEVEPYRISILPLTSAQFEFTKNKIRSDDLKGSELTPGKVAVYFRDLNESEALKLVDQLEQDATQLRFHYTFDAISNEDCYATFKKYGVQDIDLFKKVKGGGGEGFVARHQAVSIADELASNENFEVRCADREMLLDLTEILMNYLDDNDKKETRKVASWEQLDKLITLDPESLKADVTRQLNTTKKSVDRDQAQKAFTDAMSSASSTALGGTYSRLIDAVSLNFSTANSKTNAQARSIFMDALSKSGISTEWTGEKFIPKTVDIYSVSDLTANWAKTTTIKFQVSRGQQGSQTILLTQEDWAEEIPPAARFKLFQRLDQITEKLEHLDQLEKDLENFESYVDKIAAIIREDTNEVRFATKKGRNIEIKAKGERNYTNKRGISKIRNADLKLEASDDIIMRADGDVDIESDDDIILRTRGRRGNIGDIKIDAKESIKIKAKDRLDLQGNRIRFNKEPAMSIGTCFYKFQRETGDEYKRDFRYSLGRSDKIAILSGMQQSCQNQDQPEIMLHRMSQSDDEWGLSVKKWDRCKHLETSIVFMDGFGTNRYSLVLDTSKHKRLNLVESWCNDEYKANNYPLSEATRN